MTEPTDAELWQFYMTLPGATPTSQPDPIEIMRATLAKWGTPPVAKWAPEEIADGERGIRWVTNEGIHGRPTDHDVREYLKRTPSAHDCHCDECKQFYTARRPTQSQAGAVPLTPFISAQRERLFYNRPENVGKDASLADWHRIVQYIEAAHDIKRGQHGTE